MWYNGTQVSGLTFKRLEESQLEIKVGVMKPDLHLSRVYTHGFDLEQDSKDRKNIRKTGWLSRVYEELNKSCSTYYSISRKQAFCDAVKSVGLISMWRGACEVVKSTPLSRGAHEWVSAIRYECGIHGGI